MELSTYFRINASETGQFERTLIVAEEVGEWRRRGISGVHAGGGGRRVAGWHIDLMGKEKNGRGWRGRRKYRGCRTFERS